MEVKLGIAIAVNIPTIAITAINSIDVNPLQQSVLEFDFLEKTIYKVTPFI